MCDEWFFGVLEIFLSGHELLLDIIAARAYIKNYVLGISAFRTCFEDINCQNSAFFNSNTSIVPKKSITHPQNYQAIKPPI
jgi:hypothetical protein